MMANQSPPANVLADLGQWLQQWTAFIQTQIEAQTAPSTVEDGLPPPLLDKGGEMAVEQTAVPQEPSPPAHWLALFEEQGLRSLEEAAAASSEAGTIQESVVVPIDFESGQVDTAVLTAWISQMHDDILAFRKQVAPQFVVDQIENAPETSGIETAVLDVVDAEPIGENEAEMPLIEARPSSKSPAKQAAPKPEPMEMVRNEGKLPLPLSSLESLPTTSLPFEKAIPSLPPARTQAKAPVIQRKEKAFSDALPISENPMPMPPSAPSLPDGRMKDGRSTPESRIQPPRRSTPMVESEVDWPAPPTDFPANTATALSEPTRTLKRVTRLRLNPQPQNAPLLSQPTPPPGQNLVGTAVSENFSRLERTTKQFVTENRVETAVEMSDVGNPHPTKKSPEFEAAIHKPSRDYDGIKAETAVSQPNVPEFAAAIHSPPARTKSTTGGVKKPSPIKLTMSNPIQTEIAPTQFLTQPPLSPAVKPSLGGPVRDVREGERPLSPQSATNPQPEQPSAPSKPEQPIIAQDNQPVLSPKQPNYQISRPPAPRQSPDWSVTPENRWPALPPLPQPDPNPAPPWRHQPTRRQRLDREQRGVSWNESSF